MRTHASLVSAGTERSIVKFAEQNLLEKARSRPDLVKQVFTGDPSLFHAGEANAVVLEPALGPHSVLTLDEGEHMRQRKLLLPPFHGERMRGYETVIREATERAIAEWERYLQNYPGHWQNEPARERILVCRTRLADKLMRTGALYLKLSLPSPARRYFQMVATDYRDTVWVPEAELGLAMCDAREGKRQEAIAQLQAIEGRYPGTPVAKRALRERKRLER